MEAKAVNGFNTKLPKWSAGPGAGGGSRYMDSTRNYPNGEGVIGFLVSWFSFLGFWFLGFLVSLFLDFLVS